MSTIRNIILAAASAILLGGCANVMEATYSLGADAPANAAPGWASYREGMRYEREGNVDLARFAFCNAAELKYPGAAQRCEKYTLLKAARIMFKDKESRFAENVVCGAKDYGLTAAMLCSRALAGEDIAPGLRSYVALQQKQSTNKPRKAKSSAPRAQQPARPAATGTKDLIGDL